MFNVNGAIHRSNKQLYLNQEKIHPKEVSKIIPQLIYSTVVHDSTLSFSQNVSTLEATELLRYFLFVSLIV